MGATFSDDGCYRYTLWRTVRLAEGQENKGLVVFVMLNPSTADAEKDDPTIGRCRALARRWGYGQLKVVNLFAYRSPKPKELAAAKQTGKDIVGQENDDTLRSATKDANLVVCAWGQSVSLIGGGQARSQQVRRLIEKPHNLGVTRKDGQDYPLHPNSSLVPKCAKPQLWDLRPLDSSLRSE